MAKRYLKALDVAHWFIDRADRDTGEALSHLEIQTLLYFSQAYHLANYNRPLFAADFEAWAWGPAIADIWHHLKEHGWNSIRAVADLQPITDDHVTNYLETVNSGFELFDAERLRAMTHDDLPWRGARGDLPAEAACNKLITKRAIRDFYAERIGKHWESPIEAPVAIHRTQFGALAFAKNVRAILKRSDFRTAPTL